MLAVLRGRGLESAGTGSADGANGAGSVLATAEGATGIAGAEPPGSAVVPVGTEAEMLGATAVGAEVEVLGATAVAAEPEALAGTTLTGEDTGSGPAVGTERATDEALRPSTLAARKAP